jgi:hypothetical protein
MAERVGFSYPKFCKSLISGRISSDTHENRGFFAFCPFRPVCPVEPISAFYGQDGQESLPSSGRNRRSRRMGMKRRIVAMRM